MADSLASLTPEQLAITPAAQPPPGVVSNLVDPPTAAPILIAIGTALVAVMLASASIRFYVKVIVRRKVTLSDWSTLAAVIGTLWYYGICIHAVTRGKFGTHLWDISIAHTLSDDFLIASFFTNWPTGLVWAFAKTSFFLMYLEIFGPLTWLRISVYFGLFLNWGFYVAVIVASFYYQVPNPGQTWQEGFMNERYNKSFNMTIPIAAGSLFLDCYIFILPLIAVMNLHLTPRKKAGVVTVFATGLIACVASSLSIYFKHKLNGRLDDYTYWIYPVLLAALVEMCVGVFCSCMPSAAGFFKNKAERKNAGGSRAFSIFRSLLRSRKYSNVSEEHDVSWNSAHSNPDGRNEVHSLTDMGATGNSDHELVSSHNYQKR